MPAQLRRATRAGVDALVALEAQLFATDAGRHDGAVVMTHGPKM